MCSRMLDHPLGHLQARHEMNENGPFVIRHFADKSGKPNGTTVRKLPK